MATRGPLPEEGIWASGADVLKASTIFDAPFEKLRKWSEGQSLSARHLSEAPEAINKIAEHVFPPRQVNDPAVAVPAVHIEEFKIIVFQAQSINASSFIFCKRFDNSGLQIGIGIFVARPYLLRYEPFRIDGRGPVTYSSAGQSNFMQRSATIGEDQILEVITPSYLVGSADRGDIIQALFRPNGIRDENGDLLELNGDICHWLDMNVDGRVWAKESS